MSSYALTLLISFCVPFILSFYPPLKFYHKVYALLKTISIVLLLFGSWDVLAVWRGHWSFNPEAVWSVRIINLPLEEWLFFIVIPFCCIFTWEALLYLAKKNKKR